MYKTIMQHCGEKSAILRRFRVEIVLVKGQSTSCTSTGSSLNTQSSLSNEL